MKLHVTLKTSMAMELAPLFGVRTDRGSMDTAKPFAKAAM